MPDQVSVKKVTIEYAANGKRFRVDFKPERIMAIALSKIEFDRMSLQQKQSGVLEGIIHFDGTTPFNADVEEQGHKPGATSAPINGDATNEGGPLWWYTDANTWFHPQA